MSDSIWIYNKDNPEEMINKLSEGLSLLQKIVEKEIKSLKSQVEIKPIQKFETLFLETIKIFQWDDSSRWYSNKKQIRIDFSQKCGDSLMGKGLGKTDLGYKTFGISEDGLKLAHKFIDEIFELDKEKHENNIVKSKSNAGVYKALSDLLDRIGINRKYYGQKSNRSIKKDWINYNWPVEIFGQISKDYDSNKLKKLTEKHKESVQKIYDIEIEKIENERKKKEAEQKLKETNKKLVLLLAKYDLDLTCDWGDLLELVIGKNKYLYLAYYLEKNRGDWNDGCNYAEIGLRGFEVETNEDRRIFNDIESYISDWYGDGRVFRDCEYNYSVLYNIVAEQEADLYKDYKIIRENINDL